MNNNFRENYFRTIIGGTGGVCYPKSVIPVAYNQNGVITRTITKMRGETISGTRVVKTIEIDDEDGTSNESFEIIDKAGNSFSVHNSGLTEYRCAEMTVLAIEAICKNWPSRVGFIGNGRINLMNAIMISRMCGVTDIVIRGRHENPAKNAGLFMSVCDSVSIDPTLDMRLINQCDVVVVCTSSCREENLIDSTVLHGPELIVALDCGYILDESFRENRVSFCDWPKQLESHYHDEFPFDEKPHEFEFMRKLTKGEKGVVYLYGVSIADAVAGEILIERIKADGMEETFCKGAR